jgi:hypothetical protein
MYKLIFLLGVPSLAVAGGTDSTAILPRPVAGHAVFDMRVGFGTVGAAEHPYVCAEVTPVARLSVEMCGNGSGFLHRADVPDLAHFRVRGTVLQHHQGRTHIDGVVGAGLAEVQRTADSPGFRLRDDGAQAIEAAGPEISLSAKGRYWTSRKTYLIGDVNVGAAYIPGAPSVVQRGTAAFPFAMVTGGFGF